MLVSVHQSGFLDVTASLALIAGPYVSIVHSHALQGTSGETLECFSVPSETIAGAATTGVTGTTGTSVLVPAACSDAASTAASFAACFASDSCTSVHYIPTLSEDLDSQAIAYLMLLQPVLVPSHRRYPHLMKVTKTRQTAAVH